MKLYFWSETNASVAWFEGEAPAHIAAFELAEGQSTLANRYALENGELVDKYEGKTDEEVLAEIKAANDAEAERLAALHAPA